MMQVALFPLVKEVTRERVTGNGLSHLGSPQGGRHTRKR